MSTEVATNTAQVKADHGTHRSAERTTQEHPCGGGF